MITNFQPRLYQETILATAIKQNTLVVLPTGMGKTSIALMLAEKRLQQFPDSKVLIIAPTKPLADQHLQTFKNYTTYDNLTLLTGETSPAKREELYKTAKIIFCTPQGLENDIISNKIDLEQFSLIVFDEAHRAVGDYSYVWVAKQYQKKAKYPRILALTASPGHDLEKITEVCTNLKIEDIEIRTDEDPDVKPYIQEVKVDWIQLDFPQEFKEIKKYIDDCYVSKLQEIKSLGYSNSTMLSKTDLLRLQGALQSQISQGNKSFEILKSISLAAQAMKIQHALELLETQGIPQLHSYLTKLNEQAVTTKVKAVQNLVRDLNFRSALIKTDSLLQKNITHPKIQKLKEILFETDEKEKTIIFTQYRDTAVEVEKNIKSLPNIRAKVFVGQSKKGTTGLSQKQQIELLDQFRSQDFNTIIMTSVGEEGLDIPQVENVIFYEPIPSEIRTIQRRGRTGRTEKGSVKILMTKGTRDEGYRWSAHHKEKRMHSTLKTLKSKISLKQETQTKIEQPKYNINIYADHREKGTGILKELSELGANINLTTLDIADYLCSSRVAIEFKTTEDFVNSIVDGRLLEQAKQLRKNYERPLIIVEGTDDIYSLRNIHPNAILGMLATLTVSFSIPIIQTKNPKETSQLIATIAQREQQEETNKNFTPHSSKPVTLKEQQEYAVSSFPNIGLNLAKDLLKNLKTIKNITNATEEQLKQIEKVGDKKAKQIFDLVNQTYQDNS